MIVTSTGTPTSTPTGTPTNTPTNTSTNTPTATPTPTPSVAQHTISICVSNASWSGGSGDTHATAACNAVSSGNYCYDVTLIKGAGNDGSNAYPESGDTIKKDGTAIGTGYYGSSHNQGGGPQNYYFTIVANGINSVGSVVLCSAASVTPTPTRTNTPTPSKTPVSPSVTPTPSITPTTSPTPSITPTRTVSPIALYSFSGGFSTVDGATACAQANGASPKTLKSTTQSFGTGTLQDGVSVIYDQFNNIIANKYVSNGSTFGQTNSNGVYSALGLCSAP